MLGYLNQTSGSQAEGLLAKPLSCKTTCEAKQNNIRKRTMPLDHQNSIQHAGRTWVFLGEGAYNTAYHNSYRDVIKIPKNSLHFMDQAERSVRVFNEINPHVSKHEQAKMSENLWMSPFIKGHQATPDEQVDFIIKTYSQCGRLILDAYCRDNLLHDEATHTIVCIDPGNAVKRHSITSESHWYTKSEAVRARRYAYRVHMVNSIKDYQKKKIYEMAHPIFMILALDYYDRSMGHENLHALTSNNFLSLGIALYFLYAAQMSEDLQSLILMPQAFHLLLKDGDEIHGRLKKYFKTDDYFHVEKFFRALNADMRTPALSLPSAQKY